MAAPKTPLVSKSFEVMREENLELLDLGSKLLEDFWKTRGICRRPEMREAIELIRKAIEITRAKGYMTEEERVHRLNHLAKLLQG